MSSGPGSSGKPWPRLMALLSRASCDIASKMVTGRSAKTLFMEVMEASAAGPGRQSRGLRRQRGRYRALAGTAGENHLLALGVRNRRGIKGRKRDNDAAGIG